jgi:ATP-binding protein involved in chromosome partitioning
LSKFKKVVAIASGKGGVGKSTVTAGLGLAAAEAGIKVGIIDADLHGFSIPRMLGEKNQPFYDDEENLFPGEASGVKIVSMGYFAEDNPVIWRSPLYSQALRQFMDDFDWGEIDLMLIDLPPGTGDMPLNVMQNIPDAKLVVVTTPQPTAAEVSSRVAVMAQKMNFEVLGVVENMAWFLCTKCSEKHYLFGSGGGEKMAEELNTQVLGQLPLMPKMREQADAGQLQLTEEVRQVFNRLKVKIDMQL